jgi:hypothetical protein
MKWTIRGLIITLVFGPLSILLGGGGHGFAEPMVIFFPGVFAFPFVNDNGIWAIVILQFPIYGLMVDITIKKPIAAKIIIGLGLFHLLLITIALYNLRQMSQG